MFDSLFNLVIILIPLAIFIGRIVVSARNKRHPPPRAPQPHIPVHFEDDVDEDDSGYFKNLASHGSTGTRSRTQTSSRGKLIPKEEKPFPPVASSAKPSPASKKNAEVAASSGRKDLSLNLSHLSALKQAVVMAEVLGPPKGMQ